MNHSKHAFQRTVVFLDKRPRSVLNKFKMSRLTTARRIADILYKEPQLIENRGISVESILSLAGKDHRR